MFTLIEKIEIFAPEPLGRGSILFGSGRLLAVGEIDAHVLRSGGLEMEVVSGEGLLAIPGLIDPHAHLIGGSGEEGFASQTPEVHASELASCGITTVVGTLGVDTTTRTMRALLGRVKALNASGLTAFAWTGGYGPPWATITGSIRNDIVLIEEILGAGEVAIADRRALEPSARDLAGLATDCSVAGSLSGKAGLLHIHVGELESRLARIREAIDELRVEPRVFYPTHIDRSTELVHEAAELSRRGMPVDLDVFEQKLAHWLRLYLDARGDPSLLTISSDAAINSPATLLAQLRICAREEILPFDQLLACFTRNAARILKMKRKGELRAGFDADIVLLDSSSLALRSVHARGLEVFNSERGPALEPFLDKSNRRITMSGLGAVEGDRNHGAYESGE